MDSHLQTSIKSFYEIKSILRGYFLRIVNQSQKVSLLKAGHPGTFCIRSSLTQVFEMFKLIH